MVMSLLDGCGFIHENFFLQFCICQRHGSRRNNVAYIAPNILIHACGDIVHFLNLETNSQTFQPSVEGNGIGAVAVHPARKNFAVCEKGVSPNIYIYNYPSLELYKTLEDGTESYFSAANYNLEGSQLATVGGHPDYLLTVWDWENVTMILRCKAFSQEVFKVDFSRYFRGQLLTSGVGHLRFWKMASTFTGLKLEGAIAKFGTVPISDIAGYFELRNSKVLSGTESGTILVWDDALIKCQLKRPGNDVMCHDGMIEYLFLDEDIQQLTSAGADGYIRFWNLDWLEAANDGDDKLVCEIVPTKEVQVDSSCQIKGILCEPDHWIIQDEAGALWRAKLPSFEMEKLLEFHAGPIVAVASSPTNFQLASAGSDGTVRLYSFLEHREIYKRRFNAACSVLLWLPLTTDPSAQSVVVGFQNGAIRVLEQAKDHWSLIYAMKPHKLVVTAAAFTPDGTVFVSVSIDGSVFFFHAVNSFKPLGYGMVPGPITCMDWSPNGQTLLVGCSNGIIMAVACPGIDGDTTKSFVLTLAMKPYIFKRPRIKKKLPPQQPTPAPLPPPPMAEKEGEEGGGDAANKEGEAKEAEAAAGVLAAEGNAPKEGELPVEGEGADESTAPPKPPTPPPPPPPPEPIELDDPPGTTYPVRMILYSDSQLNTFYIALEGLASGYIYECHADQEETLGYTKWFEKPIKCLRYTHSKKYLISGSDNGIVRVQEAPVPGQLQMAEKSKYWEAGLHDSFYGVVGGATLSFDDHYLVCCHILFFFFLLNMEYDNCWDTLFWYVEISNYGVENCKLIFSVPILCISMIWVKMREENSASVGMTQFMFCTRAQTNGFKTQMLKDAAAITDSADDVAENMLSIEELRAKIEQDEINRLALENKNKVLAKVAQLRTTLAALLQENKERERNERLSAAEFEIDPHIRSMLKNETIAEVEQARKEIQWDSEKKNVALRKLYGFFLNPLEVEHIVLHAFASGSQVSSFRTPKLSAEFQAAVVKAREEGWIGIQTSQKERKKSKKDSAQLRAAPENPKPEKIERADEPGISKLEYRRRLLKQRDQEWAALLLTKPDMKWVSDEDLDAIEWANTHKGNFNLKSDPEYMVPDELYTNAMLKKNEMVLFGEAVYKAKMAFNSRFLELRAKKMRLHEILLETQSRIIQINSLLGSKEEVMHMPAIPKDETPELREIVTKEEQDAHMEKLAADAAAETAAEAKARAGGGLGGIGGGSKKNVEEKKEEVVVQLGLKTPEKPIHARGFRRKEKHTHKVVLSAMEEAEKAATNIRHQFEKVKLQEKMNEITTSFDDELELIRMEKFSLQVNMKCADLKMLAFYQELKVLRLLQPQEEQLNARYEKKLQQDADIQLKLNEQEKVVDAAKEEGQKFIDARKELMVQWEAMNLPLEHNPAHDVLHRMYTKKMRRPKKTVEGQEEDSEEELDDNADDDEDEYEDEEFVELCPPTADPELYADMVALRDQRCELDYLILDQNKVIDALIKEKGTILKNRNAVNTQLQAIEKEISVFQRKKQGSLNDVDIYLTLRLNQVEFMVNGVMPKDLSAGIVFSLRELQGLKDRIEAHGQEKTALKKLHKELRKQHASLNRERRFQEKKTHETENKYVEVQLLKFGQVPFLCSHHQTPFFLCGVYWVCTAVCPTAGTLLYQLQ
ncbi:hypothetical protein CY35_03G078300 [Sphagnum magellanicum]|nr:hypothetical protein CY35_03G078300 [Sphagnum magellanicum]